MRKNFSKILFREILTKIKIGISKRISFINIFIKLTPIKNFISIFCILKNIGLILHFQKNVTTNSFTIWLKFDLNNRNVSHLISYNQMGRITSQTHKSIKQIKKINLISLNSTVISTTEGILTEQQLLKLRIGGVSLYTARYISTIKLNTFYPNINLENLIHEQLLKDLSSNIWTTSIYGITYYEMYCNFIAIQKFSPIFLNKLNSLTKVNSYLITFILWILIFNSQLQKLHVKTLRLRGIGYKFERIQQFWINLNIDTNHLLISTLTNLASIRFSRKFRLIKLKTLNYSNLMQFIETLSQLKLPHYFGAKREGFHLGFKRALKFRFKKRRYRRLLSAKKRKRKRKSTHPKQIKKLKFLNLNINLSYLFR